MRVGVDDAHVTCFDAARAAADEGVAAVSLHARTAEQLYSGEADWTRIAALVELLDGTDVPVFGNGDIWEASDALRMMAVTGCAGVVVGRGCLGRPWLFRDLDLAFAGQPVPDVPVLGVVIDAMRAHVRLLVEDVGAEEPAVRDFRKHVGWYLTGYPIGGEPRRLMALASSVDELDALLDDLDRTAQPMREARRAKRGHTNGPRPVALPDRWIETADDMTAPIGGGTARQRRLSSSTSWSGPSRTTMSASDSSGRISSSITTELRSRHTCIAIPSSAAGSMSRYG